VKFDLIDKIDALDDTRILARKSVSKAEEYLADHFPTFPVLPGVMMIEALTQAAAWLLHHRTGFAKTMAVLKEARNVRYGQFVAPGHTLQVEVEHLKDTPTGATFKCTGTVDGQQSVSARIELAYFNLAEKDAVLTPLDELIRTQTRERWIALSVHTAEATRNLQI
jgi:3-hydroxyacyl-[acyl-carrier-protein] dehydratase